MEILLNLAWAACSLALIVLWIRTTHGESRASRERCGMPTTTRGTQALALLTVLLLLLPVISLSDDLIAAQGLTETDCCVRRALHPCDLHPSLVPAALALPPQEFAALALHKSTYISVAEDDPTVPASSLSRTLDSRPPPQA